MDGLKRRNRTIAYGKVCLLWLCCGLLWLSEPAAGFWGTLFPPGAYESAAVETGRAADKDGTTETGGQRVVVRFRLLEFLRQWFAADK